MLDPVMLEVKKMRTLQRKGGEMDKVKVLEKTRKYLVSPLLWSIALDGASITSSLDSGRCTDMTNSNKAETCRSVLQTAA